MRTGTMGKLLSLDARGKFGYSGGFGRIAFGYTRLGFYNWYCGIYQKRYYYGVPYISRSKFYSSSGGNTYRQKYMRKILADSWIVWHGFPPEERLRYKKMAVGRHMTGPNLFTSEYLNSQKDGGWGF